jgi:hypothetical protein
MVFPAFTPERRPLDGSDSASTPQKYLPQSRETGDVVPANRPNESGAVTKAAPVAKPWAHFVAGGYANAPFLFGDNSAMLTQS